MNYSDPIFLRKIENGETFVKKLPQTIGKLLYFHTNNTNKNPKYSESQYRTRGIIIIAISLLALLAIWYNYYSFSLGLLLIASGVAIFAILCGVGVMMGFTGTDYFIGENGYAIFSFKNYRNNIISKKEVSFDDINCILLQEHREYSQDLSNQYGLLLGSEEYNGTCSTLKLANISKKTICILNEFSYDYNEEDRTLQKDMYKFATKIQEILLSRFFEQAQYDYENNKVVTFPMVKGKQQYIHGISIYDNGDITLYKNNIKKDWVTDVKETSKELIIKYIDNFGKKQKESLELSKIANCDIMMHFLKLHHFVSEDEDAFSHYTFN